MNGFAAKHGFFKGDMCGMKFKNWYEKRGMRFVFKRGSALMNRYGFTPSRTYQRVNNSLATMAKFDCSPTFFVPAVVVQRNLPFILSLQERGCEIGVHGYNHVDLRSYPPEDSSNQLLRAAEALRSSGIDVHGFRCPYLSSSDALIQSLPQGVFKYSSNRAIEWSHHQPRYPGESLLFHKIENFYQPVHAEETLCLPWQVNGMVEIPAWVPDDLQLHDGLGYSINHITRIWLDTLHLTHQRGELFNLMFHPELAAYCDVPFHSLLQQTRSLHPSVWITRLHELAAWWRERNDFGVDIGFRQGGASLEFRCSERATLLFRGFSPHVKSVRWNEVYNRALSYNFSLDSQRLPFVGLPPDSPEWITTSLSRMGYILLTGEEALRCYLFLDKTSLSEFHQPVELINYIEGLEIPMLRFWPWPDGNRSALCITGDLDALSLIDYATRLFVH